MEQIKKLTYKLRAGTFFLSFCFVILGLTANAQSCDFTNDLTLGHTNNRNTAADYSTLYFLTNANTDTIVQISTTGGNFTNLKTGYYKVYAFNYRTSGAQPSPIPTSLMVGDVFTTGTCTGGCFKTFAYSGLSGTTVKVCNTKVCETDVLEVGGSGYNNSAGYSQLYVLVDLSGNIAATSTTGSFGAAPVTWNGYSVYMVNYQTASVTTQLNVGQAFPGALNLAGCCYDTKAAEPVTVVPTPTVTPTATNACVGTTNNVSLTGNATNTSYAWSLSAPSGYTGPTTGQVTPVAGAATISIAIDDVNTAQGPYSLTITPIAKDAIVNCVGISQTQNFQARPEPVLSTTDPTVSCSAATVALASATNCPGCSYTATACTGCSGSIPITQGTTTFTLNGATSTTFTATNSYDGGTNLCVSDPVTYNFLASPFNCLSPLPITLLSFEGKTVNKINELYWKTSTEVNSAYFEVEKSYDAVGFNKLGEKQAAGNSNTVLQYQFTDQNPKVGNNFYRLKMVDADGSYKYSNIINLPFQTKKPVITNIVPNPAHNDVTINVYSPDDMQIMLKIYNIEGKIIFDSEKEALANIGFNANINVSTWSKGVYSITLLDKAGNVLNTAKFVKM